MNALNKLILICFFLIAASNLHAQTTTIDFTTTPYKNNGNGGWDPNYFANGGCPLYYRFGPNPLPLNGHNIRTVGYTWLNTSIAFGVPPALNLYANGNHNNSNLSIEFPFKANKTYDIELNGFLDHQSTVGGGGGPATYVNAVFWLKLDNNPAISSNAPNKCESSLTPVEKIVDRYSKLIADGDRAINIRKYKVRFSTLDAKNALKIIYDPSPADPNIAFNEIFRLQNVKITEMPFEELYIGDEEHFYRNTPSETLGTNSRNNPLYQIPYTPPPRPSSTRPFSKIIAISPNQWVLANNSTYYVRLSNIIPNLYISEMLSFYLLGTNVDYAGRRELISLPSAFQNNNFWYELAGGDIFIYSNNSSLTAPINVTDFSLQYR